MGMQLVDDLPDNVVGVRATGQVDDHDYEDVLEPAIADRLTRHDKVRLLYILGPEFTGYEADAMWQDTKLGIKTFTKYDKMAVVTDASWVRHAIKAFGWLIPGEVQVYPYEQLDDARTWITS